MKFSVVTHQNYKETGRSNGMEFEQAIALVRKINRENGVPCSYVEETHTVKHLPVTVKGS